MKKSILGLMLMMSAVPALASQADCQKLAQEAAIAIKNVNHSDMGDVTTAEVKDVRSGKNGDLVYTIDVSFGKNFNLYRMTVSDSFDSCYVTGYKIKQQ